jgi:hypothetical protein
VYLASVRDLDQPDLQMAAADIGDGERRGVRAGGL